MCKFEMYVYFNSYPFVQFKFSVYGHTYRTYTRVLQCSHASVGLAQARPNYEVVKPYVVCARKKQPLVASSSLSSLTDWAPRPLHARRKAVTVTMVMTTNVQLHTSLRVSCGSDTEDKLTQNCVTLLLEHTHPIQSSDLTFFFAYLTALVISSPKFLRCSLASSCAAWEHEGNVTD